MNSGALLKIRDPSTSHDSINLKWRLMLRNGLFTGPES